MEQQLEIARPQAGSDARAGREQPIDHAHLGRFTMGNAALELEVLKLFAGQAPLTLEELRAAVTSKAWHIAAHTLKGSARAVGAWSVADVAADAEAAGPAAPSRERMLAALARQIDEATDYIRRLPRPAA